MTDGKVCMEGVALLQGVEWDLSGCQEVRHWWIVTIGEGSTQGQGCPK